MQIKTYILKKQVQGSHKELLLKLIRIKAIQSTNQISQFIGTQHLDGTCTEDRCIQQATIAAEQTISGRAFSAKSSAGRANSQAGGADSRSGSAQLHGVAGPPASWLLGGGAVGVRGRPPWPCDEGRGAAGGGGGRRRWTRWRAAALWEGRGSPRAAAPEGDGTRALWTVRLAQTERTVGFQREGAFCKTRRPGWGRGGRQNAKCPHLCPVPLDEDSVASVGVSKVCIRGLVFIRYSAFIESSCNIHICEVFAEQDFLDTCAHRESTKTSPRWN